MMMRLVLLRKELKKLNLEIEYEQSNPEGEPTVGSD